MRARPLGIVGCLAFLAALSLGAGSADAATIVALGASNTYGKGVARNQAYPAQLEAILRAKGLNVRVVNAGINGDTTEGMLQRLDRAVPNGIRAVILQPGGNDRRKGSPDRTADIQSRLSTRGIAVVMLPNGSRENARPMTGSAKSGTLAADEDPGFRCAPSGLRIVSWSPSWWAPRARC